MLDILAPRSVGNTAQQVDKQGNPLNEDGTLKVEVVASIDEISDADFMEPTRSIQLPMLPRNVDEALGANGKPVVIKKNIFERNATRHYDLTPEQSRDILRSALYNPSLYGQNQKNRKPYNWVVISVATPEGPNRLVLLEINNNRDSIDVVHWHYIDERGIEKIKRQAEREDGQLLILPPNNLGEVGALSDPTHNMPFTGKDTSSLPNGQTSGHEKSHITSDEVRVTGSLGNDIDSGLGNMVRFEGAQAKGRSEHMDAREGYQRRAEEQKREVNAWYNTISQDDAIIHDGDTIYVREFSNEHTPNSGKSLMKGTRRNNDAIAIEFTRPLSSAEFRAASDFIWRKGVAATSWQEFVDGLVEAINMTPMEPEVASASESAEADIVEPQTEVEATTETTSFTPGLVEDEYTAKLSKKRRKALHDVAVALGLRVRFVDAVRTAAGGLANADISGNEVRIAWSKRDKAISFLVGHEFTHRMQELSPKEYASFKESVKAYMGNERWNALVAKTRSIYEAHNAREMARAEAEHRAPRLLQYSVELIEDEVVADFAGELNEDANALAAFAEKLAEKPSTLKAVIAVLRDILKKLKGLVADAEAQRLANMLSKFEELYRASASRTSEGQTQSKEKYSLIGEQGATNLDKAEEATTRLDNLAVAREMETAGKDAKAIKLAAGWERGADGLWRYEIMDADVNLYDGDENIIRKNIEVAEEEEKDFMYQSKADTKELRERTNTYLAEMREKYGAAEGEETDAMSEEEIAQLQSLTNKEIEFEDYKERRRNELYNRRMALEAQLAYVSVKNSEAPAEIATTRLGYILQGEYAEQLFKAYPTLRDMGIKFVTSIRDNAYAAYVSSRSLQWLELNVKKTPTNDGGH